VTALPMLNGRYNMEAMGEVRLPAVKDQNEYAQNNYFSHRFHNIQENAW
jgi:hypothetical protein